jgi:hypothetical protein
VSVLFHGSTMVPAAPAEIWDELVDWVGQARWFPLTTMRVLSERAEGLGARIRAQHGIRLGDRRFGLTDEFTITGWEPPYELEVIHLGPRFTGVGVCTIEPRGRRSWVTLKERVTATGGKPVEIAVRTVRPAIQRQLQRSLERFATLVAERSEEPVVPVDPAIRYLNKRRLQAGFVEEASRRLARKARKEDRERAGRRVRT